MEVLGFILTIIAIAFLVYKGFEETEEQLNRIEMLLIENNRRLEEMKPKKKTKRGESNKA